ncbi:MAG: hypothetical protein U0892_20490 [Pirellulales bacterium]
MSHVASSTFAASNQNVEIQPSRESMESVIARRLLRRRFLAVGTGLVAAAGGWSLSAGEPTKRPALLVAPRGIDQLATRSKMTLQLSGTLRVPHPDPAAKKPAREAEVKAESTVEFEERIAMDKAGSAVAAARNYSQAKVSTWVAGNASSHELRDACRDVRVLLHEGVWQQYSPTQQMTAKEVDLLRMPINTVVVDQLLPTEPVKPDSQWNPSERVLAELFSLEAVHSSTVQAYVTKVENGAASIEFDGAIDGTAGGVSTKMNIKGNLTARLGTACAVVTWVGLSMTEVRAISQAEPGFTLTALVKLVRQEELNACLDVTVDELQSLAANDDGGRWMLQVISTAGRYQMLADRRWHTIIDSGEESILRLVENNNVVAQCNITRLPKLPAGQQLTMEAMQEDVKRSLGTNFVAFAEVAEKLNSTGHRLLRIVADGTSGEVPVRWIYCHLSDDTGRRVSLVFTMSGESVESFGAADDQMTGSFEMLPEPSTSAEPTPAPKAEGASVESAKVTKPESKSIR